MLSSVQFGNRMMARELAEMGSSFDIQEQHAVDLPLGRRTADVKGKRYDTIKGKSEAFEKYPGIEFRD